MIGGSGANYFDCGPNDNRVILDFNPAKGDTNIFVITVPYTNIFGPGLPNIFGALGSFPGGNLRDFNANQANSTGSLASFPGGNLKDFNANQANSTVLQLQAMVCLCFRLIHDSYPRFCIAAPSIDN
ncbi:MAG: hypothetical protein WBF33_27995 [Candidatus Nitrosopolaris sp.]